MGNCNALKMQFGLSFILVKSGANLISPGRYIKNLLIFHSLFIASNCLQTMMFNIFHNHLFHKLFFNRHPGYQPNTYFEQSSNPRFSIFRTILTSCISSLIGGCRRQSQVFSSYSQPTFLMLTQTSCKQIL